LSKIISFEQTIEFTDKLHLYVGRLVDQYGKAESAFTAMIKTYMLEALGSDFGSDEMESLLTIVVSSFRMSKSKEIIKSFVSKRPYSTEQRDWITRGLAQAGEIGFLRDRICHNGVDLSDVDPPTFAIGNNQNANDTTKSEWIYAPLESLQHASIDLFNISGLISAILSGGDHSIILRGPFPCDEQNPWRYNQRALSRRRQRTPSKP
jgi:hypothetical protein